MERKAPRRSGIQFREHEHELPLNSFASRVCFAAEAAIARDSLQFRERARERARERENLIRFSLVTERGSLSLSLALFSYPRATVTSLARSFKSHILNAPLRSHWQIFNFPGRNGYLGRNVTYRDAFTSRWCTEQK